jgi:energy-coupling factor transporter ATP-binding protein EcfA2
LRLNRLSIPSYRNLRAFEINFDESQPTTVLLGRNGSGKSNLIEAIVEIFRELELGGVPAFAYQLDYVCRGRAVKIDADPTRTGKRLEIVVDGKATTQAAFQKDLDTFLPRFVFAYYSGWSSRLERHFDRPTRKHYDSILKARDSDLPLRRLFFCSARRSPTLSRHQELRLRALRPQGAMVAWHGRSEEGRSRRRRPALLVRTRRIQGLSRAAVARRTRADPQH